MNETKPPPHSAWDALETLPGCVAVGAHWRQLLAQHRDEFAPFLTRTGDSALSYPCPKECGCWHEVVRHGPDDLVAACRCEPGRCDPIRLEPAEVELLEVSWPRLSRSLCRVLQLDRKPAAMPLPGTSQLGSWSPKAVPVLLTVTPDAASFLGAMQGLAAGLRRPFILLAPTGRHFDARSLEVLSAAGAEAFALDTCVDFGRGGELRPRQAPGQLFARFAPEPVEDLDASTARKAFALVKALEGEHRTRKAPLYGVFRLYCMEGLTIEQLARELHCSRALVCRRLSALRRKLGGDLRALRRYSSHLEQIEEALTEPRARRIDRRTAAEFEAEDDGSA